LTGRPRIYPRERVCAWCGVTYEGYPGKPKGEKTYCSRAHSTAANRAKPGHQQTAGQQGGKVRGEQMSTAREARGNSKRPPPTGSRSPHGISNSYLKKGERHIHRLVAEECLGRELQPGEIVHHEDEDKWNNDPPNLIVFPSQAVHARHHKLKHCGNPCDCPGIRLEVPSR
jgi:hypothetical protein